MHPLPLVVAVSCRSPLPLRLHDLLLHRSGPAQLQSPRVHAADETCAMLPGAGCRCCNLLHAGAHAQPAASASLLCRHHGRGGTLDLLEHGINVAALQGGRDLLLAPG